MTIKINHLDEINAAAKAFLAAVGDRRVIAFYGSMGAGKTTFIRALCAELGVTSTVTSPTFAIVNEYEGPVYHFDFYRLRHLQEAVEIGFEDYVESGHWCLIEWPELVEPLLPETTLCVHLEESADGTRMLSF